MVAIQAKDLRDQADDVLRRLRTTGEPFEIVDDGQIVARLVPAMSSQDRAGTDDDHDVERWLEEMDQLADEIAASMPEGTTALDLIRDIRREL